MERPEPVLIGYFPKKAHLRDDWLKNSAAEEICSVSECMAKGPDDWISHWKHNTTWWLFDTESAAWEVVGEDRGKYDIYAYKIFPVVFADTNAKLFIVESTVMGNLDDFHFLGYDIVSRSGDTNFECSPLSCNNGCEVYQVNRYCLIDNLEDAWRIAQEIAEGSAKGVWEPGPYYLLEVYRSKK